MKSSILALAALAALSGLSQAELLVIDEGLDNTGSTSTVGLSNNSGKAVNFVMAAGPDYTLTTVVLGLAEVADNEAPIIQIWSDEGGTTPLASLLETLGNPATLVNGANTFTSAGLTFQAGTTYWVAVNGGNSNIFTWLGNNADTSVTSDIGATHTARIFAASGQGADPALWSSSSSVLNQIQVNAEAIDLGNPNLRISPTSLHSSFAFPAFAEGENASRTIRYKVEASGGATITIDDLLLTDDPSHPAAAFTFTSLPVVPVTLGDGETIDITVTAGSPSPSRGSPPRWAIMKPWTWMSPSQAVLHRNCSTAWN